MTPRRMRTVPVAARSPMRSNEPHVCQTVNVGDLVRVGCDAGLHITPAIIRSAVNHCDLTPLKPGMLEFAVTEANRWLSELGARARGVNRHASPT